MFKNTFGGDRTRDHKIKSLALYHLSYEGSPTHNFGCVAQWQSIGLQILWSAVRIRSYPFWYTGGEEVGAFQKWGQEGIEPPTSPTRRENHTTRPLAHALISRSNGSYSLVVRTPRCGRGDPGSNPGRGTIFAQSGALKIATSAGFEPARAEPIGFQVQRLNHSAMMPVRLYCQRCRASGLVV